MERKLENGRYCVTAAGTPELICGAAETAQRLLLRLRAHRGAFWPLPNYGSRLYLLPRVKESQRAARAREYVIEALAEEQGVSLLDVRYTPLGGAAARLELEFSMEGEFCALTLEL